MPDMTRDAVAASIRGLVGRGVYFSIDCQCEYTPLHGEEKIEYTIFISGKGQRPALAFEAPTLELAHAAMILQFRNLTEKTTPADVDVAMEAKPEFFPVRIGEFDAIRRR
jgi:hypothetical protein